MSGQTDRADLDRLLAKVDLVQLIGADVVLKQRGQIAQGCCPFHNENTASFTVYRPSSRSPGGHYHCFGCGAHGDALDYLQKQRGLTFRQAVEQLGGEQPKRQARARPATTEKQETAEQLNRQQWAFRLWSNCRPIAGTPVEVYLRGRGIDVYELARRGCHLTAIKYHPALRHNPTGLDLPAMVAAVQQSDGSITGIHRTYLVADGRGKAPVSQNKMMAGACGGGCVRFDHGGETLAIGEGIESTLSYQFATRRPAWAALSLGNLGRVGLPAWVKQVVLLAEADAKDAEAYETALRQAARLHREAGREVAIWRPKPRGGYE